MNVKAHQRLESRNNHCICANFLSNVGVSPYDRAGELMGRAAQRQPAVDAGWARSTRSSASNSSRQSGHISRCFANKGTMCV